MKHRFLRSPVVLLPLLLPLLLLLAACDGSATVDLDFGPVPGAETLEEDWFRIVISGNDAGSSHRLTVRLPGGQIRTTIEKKIKLRRVSQTVETDARVAIWESGGGAVQQFRLATRLSETETVVSGVIEGDRLRLTSHAGGRTRPLDPAPFDPAARGPYFFERRMAEALKKPGDRFEAVTFFPDLTRCGRIEAVTEAEEVVDIGGAARRLLRVSIRRELLPGLDSTAWIDSDGAIWKTSERALGMQFVEIRTTREGASRPTGPPPEIFARTAIKPDRPLPNAERLKSALYRFKLRDGDFASLGIDAMFGGVGQEVVREESPSVRVVRVSAVQPGARVPLEREFPPDLAPYLRPNALIQSDDPEVASAAREAVGDETDAWDAARSLERWADRTVRDENLGTAFAPASETLRNRKGDCTEQAVLLAAGARAVGLPARVVAGFVYHRGEFLGHMWNEVWIDRWVPLDATRPGGRVGPDHIGISTSPLNETTTMDLFAGLVSIVGNLDIEVLEYE